MESDQKPNYPDTRASGEKGMMSREEIRARFDQEVAKKYSQRNPAWLPEYDFALGLVPRLIKDLIPSASRILDLGCGTGNLSARILEQLDEVQCTLLDFSPNMLREVPSVLAGYEGRYTVKEGDMFTAEPGRACFDCVASSFAIHHARGEEEYLALYSRIFQALKSPGLFVCCDVVAGDTDALSRFKENGWRNHLGMVMDESMIDDLFEHYYREDSPIAPRAHLDLLRSAGFSAVDVLWSKHNFCLYCAVKGST